MLESNQIGSKLTKGRLNLADFDTRATDISLELFQIGQGLVEVLLQTIDITAEENTVCAGLADGGLKLKNTRLELVHIGPQRRDIQVNTIENGAVGIEFTADVFILAVSAVDITIFGQDG